MGGASASSNSSAVSQLPLAYLQNQKVAFASSHAGPSRPDEATTSRMNTAVISSAASSTPPSPHHIPIASRYLGGHAGGSAPPAWAAAPQGFLSNLTPEDIQVSSPLSGRTRLMLSGSHQDGDCDAGSQSRVQDHGPPGRTTRAHLRRRRV